MRVMQAQSESLAILNMALPLRLFLMQRRSLWAAANHAQICKSDNHWTQALLMITAGQAGMLRAKQQLLALLLERVRDQTSYTRKQVVASWTLLAEHAKIPISHWVPVAELAIGRILT